ncbi:MAG: nuclear transport factor 2 family protein, partial [Rhodospirillales bacterium]
NPNAPEIRCHNASVSVIGDTAYVVCNEILKDKGFLIATNIFVREGSLWRMIHHQAGTAPPPPREALQSDPEPMQ